MFYNSDCVKDSKKYLKDESVDLIITDPPYGIEGDTLHKHYNRDERFVYEGYVEVPKEMYFDFSLKWIKEAERVLRPGGSIYIISGYTNLSDIMNALNLTNLKMLNHIIWKYNFGVYTKRKFVSSHYHILLYVKPGAKHTFHLNSRYSDEEKDENGRSLNYSDREDVWIIKREYKRGEEKNKNELPKELLVKMLQYSSNEGDLVCDFFLGSFKTALVSLMMGRKACGFEINARAYKEGIKKIELIEPGSLLKETKSAKPSKKTNRGKPWTEEEETSLFTEYKKFVEEKGNNRGAIDYLSKRFLRGRFSIINKLKTLRDKE